MKKIIAFLLFSAAIPVYASSTSSFSGEFTNHDDVQLFNFSVASSGDVVIRTFSYGGGTNAQGTVIPHGGFDPVLTLFNSAGILLSEDDDNDVGSVAVHTNIDPDTTLKYDSVISIKLNAGDYTVAVSQYDRFFNGTTFDFNNPSSGFQSINSNFHDSSHEFIDDEGNFRTGSWAADVTLPAAVPVPAAVWFLGTGLLGLVGFRKKA